MSVESGAWTHVIEHLAPADACSIICSCHTLQSFDTDELWNAIFHAWTRTPSGSVFGSQPWRSLVQASIQTRKMACDMRFGRAPEAPSADSRTHTLPETLRSKQSVPAMSSLLCMIEDQLDGHTRAIYVARVLPHEVDVPTARCWAHDSTPDAGCGCIRHHVEAPWDEVLRVASVTLLCTCTQEPAVVSQSSRMTFESTWELSPLQLDTSDHLRGVVARPDGRVHVLSVVVHAGVLVAEPEVLVESVGLVARDLSHDGRKRRFVEFGSTDGKWSSEEWRSDSPGWTGLTWLNDETQHEERDGLSAGLRVTFSNPEHNLRRITPDEAQLACCPWYALAPRCTSYDSIVAAVCFDRHGCCHSIGRVWPTPRHQNIGLLWHSAGRHLCMHPNDMSHSLNDEAPLLITLPRGPMSNQSTSHLPAHCILRPPSWDGPDDPTRGHAEGRSHLGVCFSSARIHVLTQEANFCLPHDINLPACELCERSHVALADRRCHAMLRSYHISDGSLADQICLDCINGRVQQLLFMREQYPNLIPPLLDELHNGFADQQPEGGFEKFFETVVALGGLHLRPEGVLHVSPNGLAAAFSMRYCFAENPGFPWGDPSRAEAEFFSFQTAPLSVICVADISNAERPRSLLEVEFNTDLVIVSAAFTPDSSLLFWQLGYMSEYLTWRDIASPIQAVSLVNGDIVMRVAPRRSLYLQREEGLASSFLLSYVGNTLAARVHGSVLFWHFPLLAHGACSPPLLM